DMWGPQDDQDSINALYRAIDLGINFIDTAQGYGKGHSEEIIGRVLRNRKEEIYVATKIPPVPGTRWPMPEDQDIMAAYPPDYIIRECEKSLKRLQRECIDIYQFHTWCSNFNIRDEWHDAMSKLRQQGKIRAIGVSVPDLTPDSVIGALAMDKVDAVQVVYNIFEQAPLRNLFPVTQRLNKAVIVRVPFDEGALTGKYTNQTKFVEGDVRNRYFRGRNFTAMLKRVDRVREFKNRHHPEMSLADFALRFCLSHAAVSSVIPGIRNVQQAESNASVSDGKILERAELQEMEQLAWKKDFWFNEIEDNME
ncbi:MAG: aldo/keto reductase, partial [Calditrichaeota bacterium]